jgi:integrase
MIIPEPRFYLKVAQAIEPTLICMQAKYNSQRVFISTGDKIHPDDWDFVKQRAKVTRKNLSHGDINTWLDKMATEFKSIFRNCLIDEIVPSATVVTQKLQEKLNLNYKPPEPIQVKPSLFKFIEQYIKESAVLKSSGTIKTYNATYKHLKKYSLICSKEFDFEDITMEWRSGFIKYLQSLGAAKNTEGKHIKNLKVFLNEATERNLNTNLSFRSKSFSKPAEDVVKIFLTKEEIQKLIDVDFQDDPSKDLVRDYFVISCMTSLRYSDFIDIKQENIKGDTIQLITKKTGEEVIIPIAPVVKKILEKYNYNLPKAPCNQSFNSLLKDVGRLAKLTEPVTITKTIGGVKKTKVYEKYELLTCHTGRRSMISNSILAGMPTSSIMLISAHKSLKVFQGYVRINQKQNADALASHTFFS